MIIALLLDRAFTRQVINMKLDTCKSGVAMMSLAVLLAGPAQAALGTAPYNIVVKDTRGLHISCPPNGLSFTNSQGKGNGDYPPESSPAPSIKICQGLNPRITGTDGFSFNTNESLQVRVARSSLKGQDQGQNVAGLVGRMTGTKLVSGQNIKLAIAFTTSGPNASGQFSRNYTIYRVLDNGSEQQLAVGTYHISNLNSVPEPGSMALIAIGLLGLGFMATRRRTNA